MKNVRVHFVVILAALAVLTGALSFAVRNSRGQTQGQESDTLMKPAVLLTERAGTPEGNVSSPFAGAAARNATLTNEMNWTFGGKHQRGWYLYNLLIGQTLNTESASDTSDFADALTIWQRNHELDPDGMLDEESFMAMVAQWQGNRLKNRAYAEPDQLLTAPPSDFYDPERLAELRQVEAVLMQLTNRW